MCEPIPPSEWLAWQQLTHNKIGEFEYVTLRAMDAAYCDERGKELADYHTRMEELRKSEIEASKRKKR